MLNKELMISSAKRDQRIVTMVAGRYRSGRSEYIGYKSMIDNYGSLNVIPFWGTADCTLVGLYDIYAGTTLIPSYVAMIYNKLNHDLTIAIGNASCTIPKGSEQTSYFSSPFKFKVDTQYNLVFDPPPDGYLDPITKEPL